MRASLMALSMVAGMALVACTPAPAPGAAVPEGTAGAPGPIREPTAAEKHAASTLVFRATGNEPGWLAEVDAAGAGMRVEVDYGQTRYEVAAPSEGADGWAGKSADGIPVKLSVQRVPCQDGMSGQQFEAKAMLTVGTRQLHGCGNYLAK